MATLTVQQITLTGTTPSYAACASGGDEFVNDGQTFIQVKNASGGELTVTVNSRTNCNQGSDHDVAVAIPLTTGDKMIGPFPPSRFNNGDGKVTITYSGVTSLTIAAIKF